jgi:hypothetical protein
MVCAFDSWKPENYIQIMESQMWAMGTFIESTRSVDNIQQ